MKYMLSLFSILLCGFAVDAQSENSLPPPTIEEYFVDSSNIGAKKRNKIEMTLYRQADSNYVVIKFYSKLNKRWNLKQTFSFEKDAVLGLDPGISDFNNDGFNDLNYVSDIAARGGNRVTRLFVYDKASDKLMHIINSEEYPNMRYNRELNCVDAFLIYGGCSTVFARLEGNKLRTFASVELQGGLIISTYDKKGRQKIIHRDMTVKTEYQRYKNYDPLVEF